MRYVFAILLLCTVLLAGCVSEVEQPTFTRNGIVRDTIFSAEERGNGTLVLFPTHSDVDAYCIPHPTTTAQEIMRENGEAIIHVKSMPISFDATSDYQRCMVEISGTFTIQLVVSIEFTNRRQ